MLWHNLCLRRSDENKTTILGLAKYQTEIQKYRYLKNCFHPLSFGHNFQWMQRHMFGSFQLRHSDQRTVALVLAVLAVLGGYRMPGKQETIEPKQYTFRIDLNTATPGELQTLPGIGPKLAGSIISYRDQHAPIDDFDEIRNVSGIGPKRYSNLKPYFTD